MQLRQDIPTALLARVAFIKPPLLEPSQRFHLEQGGLDPAKDQPSRPLQCTTGEVAHTQSLPQMLLKRQAVRLASAALQQRLAEVTAQLPARNHTLAGRIVRAELHG